MLDGAAVLDVFLGLAPSTIQDGGSSSACDPSVFVIDEGSEFGDGAFRMRARQQLEFAIVRSALRTTRGITTLAFLERHCYYIATD